MVCGCSVYKILISKPCAHTKYSTYSYIIYYLLYCNFKVNKKLIINYIDKLYSRSSIIWTALAKIYWKGVQISEFVWISKAKPNILDTAVSNFYVWLKDHTQLKIQFVQYSTLYFDNDSYWCHTLLISHSIMFSYNSILWSSCFN